MTLTLKTPPSDASLRALIQALYKDCFLHTSLTLTCNSDDWIVATTAQGQPVFSLFIDKERHDRCVTLKQHTPGGATLHSDRLETLLPAVRQATEAYPATLVPEWQRYDTAILNVPDWFADPVFIAWLDTPEQRGFTYHRHGDTIGEYSDVIVMIDELEGDSSDMPVPYWRQVVQAAHAYNVRSVRLTNLQA